MINVTNLYTNTNLSLFGIQSWAESDVSAYQIGPAGRQLIITYVCFWVNLHRIWWERRHNVLHYIVHFWVSYQREEPSLLIFYFNLEKSTLEKKKLVF